MMMQMMTTLVVLTTATQTVRGGGGSCAAAKKCCDGRDPECAVGGDGDDYYDYTRRKGGQNLSFFVAF